jgi:hypothetical protein
MGNASLRDFYERIARILKARARGYGFEAAGALGRSHYTRHARLHRRLRVPVMAPVLILFGGVIVLKAVIYRGVGAGVYDARVDALWQGEGVERVGAMVMHADPLTRALSDMIARLIG